MAPNDKYRGARGAKGCHGCQGAAVLKIDEGSRFLAALLL
jgi:hypothetical protein